MAWNVLTLFKKATSAWWRPLTNLNIVEAISVSTYATWLTKQTLTRSIAGHARTIRIPVHMIETINKLLRTSKKFMHDIGREPTPEERAENRAMLLGNICKVMKLAKEPISLETLIGNEEDNHVGDFTEDKKGCGANCCCYPRQLTWNHYPAFVNPIPKGGKSCAYASWYWHEHDNTLEEVGQRFAVTRERIRLIEAKALRKIKHLSKSRKLCSFLDTWKYQVKA